MDRRLQDLNFRFSKIEQSLEQLRNNTTTITIENVHIHQPVLEKMEYRLDSLDIEQLSGSLNLGNNFGAKIDPVSPSSASNLRPKTDASVPSGDRLQKQAAPSPKPANEALPGLLRTQTGYRITRTDPKSP